MADEYTPGAISRRLAWAKGVGEARSREALMATAMVVVRQAKVHVREGGEHAWGTPSPARPGSGPAVVSGQLARSITHEERAFLGEYAIAIGPASTPRARGQRETNARARSGRGRAKGSPSNGKVGRYLETGIRNGARYPFLLPAFREGIAANGATWKAIYSRPWV